MVQLIIVVKTRFFPSVVRSELVEQVDCAFSQLRGVNRREAYLFPVGSKCLAHSVYWCLYVYIFIAITVSVIRRG